MDNNDELDLTDYLFNRVIDEYEDHGFNMDDVIEDYEHGNVDENYIRMLARGTLYFHDF